MEPIIDPIAPEIIESELTEELFLRDSNNAGNKIYHFTADQAPQTMQELGRLREIAFREAGGGTGKSVDIDEFDICDTPYTQLIVWDPDTRMILGGYRYIACNVLKRPEKLLATGELFTFSDLFVESYMPYTIELGRSFVHPAYQSSTLKRKGIFALDNLWDGLGALVILNPWMRYFFGKVTMYPHFDKDARSALLHFLELYFPDKDELIRPIHPLPSTLSQQELDSLFSGNDYKADRDKLNAYLTERNERIPPLIKSYVGLSSTMKMFGTAINPGFGEVEETGILLSIEDIYDEKLTRHVESFKPHKLNK